MEKRTVYTTANTDTFTQPGSEYRWRMAAGQKTCKHAFTLQKEQARRGLGGPGVERFEVGLFRSPPSEVPAACRIPTTQPQGRSNRACG
eukprot:1305717-Amphidinium_carterae.1